MGTITSLMNIAQQAIAADQAELTATANNVANQSTAGYTDEVVNTVADTVTINGVPTTDGVQAQAPVSQRDPVLEQQVQQQTQVEAQSSAVESALSQVQSIFGLTSTSSSSSLTTLGTDVDNFFSSLTALASNPDSSTRQDVLAAASTLASTFNETSSQLNQVSTSLQNTAATVASEVNPLLTQIATLNQEIGEQSPNADAGVLQDQRQEAVDQLSQYIGVDQISTGDNQIQLTTTSGGLLVAGDQSFAISTGVTSGAIQVYAGPNNTNVTAGLTGGQLGGVIQVNNSDLPSISSSIDTLAYSIGTAVNTQNEAGVDETGTAGVALFTLGTTSVGAAGTIAVTTTNPQLVAAASTGEGTSGTTNATALAALSTTAIVGTQTADEYLSATLSQVGEVAQAATNDATVQQASLSQLTSERNSLSAVSLDQEAGNLTTYQRSYQAASQVFTIVDSLMASAINLGVETAVS